jgi:hypothetical protein
MSLHVSVCPMCRDLHQARGRLHRQSLLDRISYPTALLIAAVLGFQGTLIGLSVSEAPAAVEGAISCTPISP